MWVDPRTKDVYYYGPGENEIRIVKVTGWNNWVRLSGKIGEKTTNISINSYAVNAGGSTVGSFVADNYVSGGVTASTTGSINLTGVLSPAPAGVYQSERTGNFTYTFNSLKPNVAYTVRLHFAETQYSQADQRKINVDVNGVRALTGFDIYATAKARNKAVVRELAATTTATGQVKVAFTSSKGSAKLCGIEIVPGSPVPPPAEPEPEDPKPTDPKPVDPTPDPEPEDPKPTDPKPVDPTPDPEPEDPKPTDPKPVDPTPEPEPEEPKPTDPKPVDPTPKPEDPKPTDPKPPTPPTEPKPTTPTPVPPTPTTPVPTTPAPPAPVPTAPVPTTPTPTAPVPATPTPTTPAPTTPAPTPTPTTPVPPTTPTTPVQPGPIVVADPVLDDKKIKVFPNPAVDKVNVTFQSEKDQEIRVQLVDAQSNVIAVMTKPAGANTKLTFQVSHLPSGLYFLYIKKGDQTIVRKVLVQKNR
jgi:hypothetical protein